MAQMECLNPSSHNRLSSVVKEIVFACIGGGLLFGLILGIQATIEHARLAQDANALHIGSVLSGLKLQGIRADRGTLVIAISASCPYSRKNLGFHRDLLKSAWAAGLDTIVVVPDKKSADFVHRELAAYDAVFVTNLRSIGIMGTPTIAALDAKHCVRHLWTGALPARLQQTVFSQVVYSLHTLTTPADSELRILGYRNPTQVSREKSSGAIIAELSDQQLTLLLRSAKLLDISPRALFIPINKRCINIPSDELSVRARYELDRSSAWIVNCSRVDASACDLSVYLLGRAGFNSVLVLDRGAMGVSCQTTPSK
jgi:hypothetical protein